MTKRTRRGEKEKRRRGARVVLLLFLVVLAAACSGNENILRSGKETPAQANVERPKPSFATDLEEFRTAGFSFIYVLRRKDGGQIDAEDRSVIKMQTADANRRVAADEGMAVIIGSNFQIPAKNMMVLYDRFAVENYSPAPAVNANANNRK